MTSHFTCLCTSVLDDVHIVKKRNVYGQWTQEESKALLKIKVDVANRR